MACFQSLFPKQYTVFSYWERFGSIMDDVGSWEEEFHSFMFVTWWSALPSVPVRKTLPNHLEETQKIKRVSTN